VEARGMRSNNSRRTGGRQNAGVSYEMPCQKGDEGYQGTNHEEWEAGVNLNEGADAIYTTQSHL